MPAPSIRIDRISISVPGVERELGARLAQLVAERLAPPLQLATADASLPRLHVELTAAAGESLESLSDRVVARVSLALGGSVLEAGR